MSPATVEENQELVLDRKLEFLPNKIRIINCGQELKRLGDVQTQAKQSEEDVALHPRDAGAAASSSGVVEGRSFADSVRN